MQNSEDREALRREIQAAIKAGRELEPDMDTHLADSALERYEAEQKARGLTPVAAAPRPAERSDGIARVVPMMLSAAIFITILLVNHNLWWLIFCIGPLMGGWWGWGRRHHEEEDPQGAALQQQYRHTKRRLKIEAMEAEIKRLRGEDRTDR